MAVSPEKPVYPPCLINAQVDCRLPCLNQPISTEIFAKALFETRNDPSVQREIARNESPDSDIKRTLILVLRARGLFDHCMVLMDNKLRSTSS
jgi:hypothetical protein